MTEEEYIVGSPTTPTNGATSLSGIVMGVGCPVVSKVEGKSMCAIVLGKTGLFRIYPIPGKISLPVWTRVEVKAKKGSDTREESWKLLTCIKAGKISDGGEKRAILNRCVLKSGAQDPIDFQNEQKKSICVVSPKLIGGGILPQRASTDNSWVYSQDMAWNKPYLTWTSKQGKEHHSHIVSREAYQTIFNQQDKPYAYYNNVHIGDPDWDFWLIMGNIIQWKRTWVVVHLHRLKKTTGLSTPHYCDLISGKPDAWPYSTQQNGNVPAAKGQLLMSIIEDI